MAKTVFKQIRLKEVPADVHKRLKIAAAMADKTLEEWIVEILRKSSSGK